MSRPGRVANPSSVTGEPIHVSTRTDRPISDRGYRYRANQVLDQLPAQVRNTCHFCGRRSGFGPKHMAAHLDGFEENGDPSNISATCRSCNNTIAANFSRNGVGRRTIQFNPARRVSDDRQYADLIAILKDSDDRDAIERAIARLQATSHHDRAKFARSLQKASQ